MSELVTARLVMRPFDAGDVDALHALWTDPDVRRYLWDDVAIPRETAAEVVEATLRDWSERGYGMWIVTRAGEVAGFTGFRSSEQGPELLFGFYRRYWHQGLATEAGRAALDYLFETLRLPFAWGATDPPNQASVRVMERLGMRFERRGELEGRDTLFFTTTRA